MVSIPSGPACLARAATLCAAALACLALTACFRASAPAHFYVLAEPPVLAVPAGSRDQAAGVPPRMGPRVGIMPLSLPGYLQRPQIVVRQGDNVDIRREDEHRWAEDLGEGMSRVLGAAMTNSLADIQGVVMPLRTGVPVDLRVQVEARRFEGSPGGEVFLDALWSVQRDGKTLREGHFAARHRAGPGMASLVEAHSILLEKLGTELAAGVRQVLASDS
ncbi:MAG: membrane integrity-associated transporter subunit PqiC [Desulfovibrionaceae bacterium]|nr:membrane integrity-associated transporter subunit PqiC [Desulfovibrionaceae bacterium]